MNTIQKITKNVGVLLISQILSYFFGFFILIYSARYLGLEGFGTLSLALALTGIFTVIMDLGLSTLTTRELSRDKSITKKYLPNIITMKIVLSLFSLCLIYFIVYLLGYNQQTTTIIYLIAFYNVFNTFSVFFYAVFQAKEKMEYQSLGVIFSSILILAGVLLAIYYKFNIIQFSSIYTIVGFIVLVYVFLIFLWKYNLPKIKFDVYEWKDLIIESWPFAITQSQSTSIHG